ncbi:hypothetical protein DFQ26_007589 [Actinomortierella ambigua]|nr:hypothetical protein DFQ26_007589 [Actinomortierella ambigua]
MSTSAKVYVGNLGWASTEDTLRSHFQAFGAITDVVVMKDRDTGRSRGFGFVTYENKNDADTAILQLNDSELDGRRIKVSIATERDGKSNPSYGSSKQGGYSGGYSGGYGYSGGQDGRFGGGQDGRFGGGY